MVAAGSTGSIPATAELLGVIARLPNGAVVLPGLDRELDEESWQRLDPGHPQFALKQLLERIGVAREDVADWLPARASGRANAHAARGCCVRRRPRMLGARWPTREAANSRLASTGLTLVEAADPAEEAFVVALSLREALETPSTRRRW